MGYFVYEATYESFSLNTAVPEELAFLIAGELTYVICFAEKLFDPNDLGYVADQTCSTARREENKFQHVET